MRKRAGRERGSVLLLVAILMGVVIGFAGLAVDVGSGYVVRSILQHAVDDGALSALRWSAQLLDSPGGDPGGVAQEAVQEGLQIAQRELQSQGVSGIARVSAIMTGEHLTLTASARVPTYFLVLFGLPSWTPRVRSDTALWTPSALSARASAARSGPGGSVPGAPLPGRAGAEVFVGSPGNGPVDLGQADLDNVAPDTPASPGASDVPGACNCDSIAAGDAASARAALERMGATPADPGPFRGDMSSQLGMGEMQSHPDGGGTQSGGDDGGF